MMILYGMMLGMGCSTKRNTPGTRAYHELTTRYNIYYNAEVTYNEILDNQWEYFTEDYTTFLPFYPSAPLLEKKSSGGPFDPVVDKTSRAIQAHSIAAKPRRDPSQPQTQEFSQWLRQEEFNPVIHKVWLLLGKAYLQNKDYAEALETFMQIQRLFKQNKELITETEIWLLRTYTEMGRDYDAENMRYVLQSKTMPPHLYDLYTEIYTASLIHKKEYTAAIPWLKKVIDREKNFRQKKRLQYLLGQIYVLNGEKTTAWKAFEDVKGLSTPAAFNRQALLAQRALQDKSTPTKIINLAKKSDSTKNPRPTDKSLEMMSPNRIAKELSSDSALLTDRGQTPSFQDYYHAYLKRSSLKKEATNPVSLPSPNPKIADQPSLLPSAISRPETMEELKKRLEQKTDEALRKKQEPQSNKSRKTLLKERENERKEKIRQREKELRERERKREAAIKQREQQREQQMRKQQRQ